MNANIIKFVFSIVILTFISKYGYSHQSFPLSNDPATSISSFSSTMVDNKRILASRMLKDKPKPKPTPSDPSHCSISLEMMARPPLSNYRFSVISTLSPSGAVTSYPYDIDGVSTVYPSLTNNPESNASPSCIIQPIETTVPYSDVPWNHPQATTPSLPTHQPSYDEPSIPMDSTPSSVSVIPSISPNCPTSKSFEPSLSINSSVVIISYTPTSTSMQDTGFPSLTSSAPSKHPDNCHPSITYSPTTLPSISSNPVTGMPPTSLSHHPLSSEPSSSSSRPIVSISPSDGSSNPSFHTSSPSLSLTPSILSQTPNHASSNTPSSSPITISPAYTPSPIITTQPSSNSPSIGSAPSLTPTSSLSPSQLTSATPASLPPNDTPPLSPTLSLNPSTLPTFQPSSSSLAPAGSSIVYAFLASNLSLSNLQQNILSYHSSSHHVTQHPKVVPAALVDYELSSSCDNVLRVAVGEVILGGNASDVTSISSFVADISMDDDATIFTDTLILDFELNITSILSNSSLSLNSSQDIIFTLNHSIASGSMESIIRSLSGISCASSSIPDSSCCSSFIWTLVCLPNNISTCYMINSQAIDNHGSDDIYCYYEDDDAWNQRYDWPGNFSGYVVWLLVLLIMWICGLCVAATSIYSTLSTWLMPRAAVTAIAITISQYKMISSILACLLGCIRLLYVLLLASETIVQGFGNFACVEFSVNDNYHLNNVPVFWNPYFAITAALFYPLALLIVVTRRRWYKSYTDNLGIVVESTWLQLSALSLLMEQLGLMLGILIIVAEIITITLSTSYDKSYPFILLSIASQIVCSLMIIIIMILSYVDMHHSRSSMNIDRIAAIERQNRVVSDNASVFSITSLLKTRSDLRKQRSVRFMSRHDHSLHGSSIPEGSEDNDDDISNYDCESFGVDIHRVQLNDEDSSIIPPVTQPASASMQPMLSLDQTLSEVSSLSLSQTASHAQAVPGLSNITTAISIEENSSDTRAGVTVNPAIDGRVVSDDTTMIIGVMLAILMLLSAVSEINSEPIGAFIVSSILLRVVEVLMVFISLSEMRVRRNQWRLLARRTVDSRGKHDAMMVGKNMYHEQQQVGRGSGRAYTAAAAQPRRRTYSYKRGRLG